jgi:hypothetical protein
MSDTPDNITGKANFMLPSFKLTMRYKSPKSISVLPKPTKMLKCFFTILYLLCIDYLFPVPGHSAKNVHGFYSVLVQNSLRPF